MIHTMGSVLGRVHDNDFRAYRRSAIDDLYAPVETQRWDNITLELALARFKHEVFAYCLEAYEYVDTKAIYLYHGNARLLRAQVDPEQFHLTITGSVTKPFVGAPEALGVTREILMHKHFVRKYNNRPIAQEGEAFYALRDYD